MCASLPVSRAPACASLIRGLSLIICQLIQQSITYNTDRLAPALHSSFSRTCASSTTYLRKVPSPLHIKQMKCPLNSFPQRVTLKLCPRRTRARSHTHTHLCVCGRVYASLYPGKVCILFYKQGQGMYRSTNKHVSLYKRTCVTLQTSARYVFLDAQGRVSPQQHYAQGRVPARDVTQDAIKHPHISHLPFLGPRPGTHSRKVLASVIGCQ